MRPSVHFALWSLGRSPAETPTTAAERDCLARHAAGKRRVVEIGVWHGVTTCRLRAAMAPDGLLFAVDPYPRGRLGLSLQQIIAHATVKEVRNGRVRWLRETGAAAGRLLAHSREPPVDFVFIDGDHTYEGLRADWEAWKPLIATGGIVALHDSRSSDSRRIDDAGSVRFTREVILADPDFRVEETVDSLTVLRCTAEERR